MSKYLLFITVLLLASCAPKAASPTPQPIQPTSIVKASLDTKISTATPLPEIQVGVVIVDTLNVRQGPGTSYPTVGSLNQGEKFYVLAETTNSTNNKWLLVSLPDNSFGWIIGDRIYVTVKNEAVDYVTYSDWQKSMDAAKAQALIPVTSP